MGVASIATRIGRGAVYRNPPMWKMAYFWGKLGGLSCNHHPVVNCFTRYYQCETADISTLNKFQQLCRKINVYGEYPLPRPSYDVKCDLAPADHELLFDLGRRVTEYPGPLDDETVVEPAKYAIEEYNRREGKDLVFVGLSSAAVRDVCGFNYFLKLVVLDGDLEWPCLAKVYRNDAKNQRFELHAFRILAHSCADPLTDDLVLALR